jgi:hypothetical protein
VLDEVTADPLAPDVTFNRPGGIQVCAFFKIAFSLFATRLQS